MAFTSTFSGTLICCCSMRRRRWKPETCRALSPSSIWSERELVSPYTIANWPDQATARNAVQLERRLELGMEGQRLFDLRRYGGAVAQQVMTDYLTKEATPQRRGYKNAQLPYATPLNNYYPIPQVEIDLSKVGGQSRLCQNAGWGAPACP